MVSTGASASRALRLIDERDPRRRVIARAGEPAYPLVDTRREQPRPQLGVEQQVVDAQPRVAFPMLAEVVPEGEYLLAGIELADRVRPALGEEPPVALAALRLQQRVLLPRACVVDVEVGRHDVEVADERDRPAAAIQSGRVLDEALEPRE